MQYLSRSISVLVPETSPFVLDRFSDHGSTEERNNLLLIDNHTNDNHALSISMARRCFPLTYFHWLHIEKSKVFDELLRRQVSPVWNSSSVMDAEDRGDLPDPHMQPTPETSDSDCECEDGDNIVVGEMSP